MIDLSVVISKSPNEGFHGIETFDLAMAGAVFDWHIALFFVGDGLKHCYLNSNTNHVGDLTKRWMSASLFGVKQLYRLKSPWPKTVKLGPIAEQITPISYSELQNMLGQSRRVMVL